MIANFASVAVLVPLLFSSVSVTTAVPVLPVQCGSSSSSTPANLNLGIANLKSFDNIVAFGDSWTSGSATWVGRLANAAGASLLDYAAPGAVIDKNVWPGTNFPSDFVTQGNTHISSHLGLNSTKTLHAVFFGIGDYAQSLQSNPNYLDLAAQALVFELLRLTSSPEFAKNIVVIDNYGLGRSSPTGEQYKQSIFEGVKALKRLLGINVAFVDLAGLRVSSPTPVTQAMIAQYVKDVLATCGA